MCVGRWRGPARGGTGKVRESGDAVRAGGGRGLRVDADGLEEGDEGVGNATSREPFLGSGGVVGRVEDAEDVARFTLRDDTGAESGVGDLRVSKFLDEFADGTGGSRRRRSAGGSALISRRRR